MTNTEIKTEPSYYSLLYPTILLISFVKVSLCGTSLSDEIIDLQSQINLKNGFKQVGYNSRSCEVVYQEYLTALENYTHCEINQVRPFRLCLSCYHQYQAMDELFTELNTHPEHEACRTKYLMSDRVQIILTVQSNAEKMWKKCHCRRCYRNETEPPSVKQFTNLLESFQNCSNITGQDDMCKNGNNERNSTDICVICKSQYSLLNAHFNAMYEADKGDVCMDIMDMMNCTRIMWNTQLKCTPAPYDSTPVIIISCVVACTPILFYVYVRVTGKVREAKLIKGKRLPGNTDVSNGSFSTAGSSSSTS